MKGLNLILLLIIGYLIIFPSSLSAELSNFQAEVIRVAFMNGYASAIQGDIDTIKALKQDQKKLKKYSEVAVNKYMEKVSLLNQDDKKAVEKEQPTHVGANTYSF